MTEENQYATSCLIHSKLIISNGLINHLVPCVDGYLTLHIMSTQDKCWMIFTQMMLSISIFASHILMYCYIIITLYQFTLFMMFSDNTSVNRFVISEAILRLLHLMEVCHDENSVLYNYNTDGIYISNLKVNFKNKKGVKKIGRAYVTDSKLCYFEKHYRDNMNMDDYKTVNNNSKSCIYNGKAGPGKTTKLCEMVRDAKNPLVLSFTNKAIENVKDRLRNMTADIEFDRICHTFDSYFCEWNGRDLNSLNNKTIFIKEFSMIPK